MPIFFPGGLPGPCKCGTVRNSRRRRHSGARRRYVLYHFSFGMCVFLCSGWFLTFWIYRTKNSNRPSGTGKTRNGASYQTKWDRASPPRLVKLVLWCYLEKLRNQNQMRSQWKRTYSNQRLRQEPRLLGLETPSMRGSFTTEKLVHLTPPTKNSLNAHSSGSDIKRWSTPV